MTTYKDLQQRIANELCRDDLTSQIKQAIHSAIRDYQAQYFLFNQTTGEWATKSNQPLYSAGKGLPKDYLKANQLALIYNQCVYPLHKVSVIDANPFIRYVGQPYHYRMTERFIELFPIPDQKYYISISYTKFWPLLIKDEDSNPWTNEVQDLIVYQAKYLLFKHIIGEHDEAAEMERCAKETYQKYLAEAEEIYATGKVQAMAF